MTCVLAIDPGPEQSAYILCGDGGAPVTDSYGIVDNESLIRVVRSAPAHHMAIEGIACYGMPVGKETFDTCIWIGRFIECFASGSAHTLIYRPDVKMHLCHSMRAKDPMVRQALIDRFGPGKARAIGKKANPGPLYGISSHVWSALAVAVVWHDWQRSSSRRVG